MIMINTYCINVDSNSGSADDSFKYRRVMWHKYLPAALGIVPYYLVEGNFRYESICIPYILNSTSCPNQYWYVWDDVPHTINDSMVITLLLKHLHYTYVISKAQVNPVYLHMLLFAQTPSKAQHILPAMKSLHISFSQQKKWKFAWCSRTVLWMLGNSYFE